MSYTASPAATTVPGRSLFNWPDKDVLVRNLPLYGMIAPVLLYFIIFVFYPLYQGAVISFQEFGLLGAMGFAGLENYYMIFEDPDFIQATTNTIIISAGLTIFGTMIPLVPAIALNEIMQVMAKRFFQTVIYLPNLFSWVIILGIWMNVLSPIGLLNSFLISLGVIDAPIMFFSSEEWARPLLIAQTVWKDMGYNAVIYLAALISINPEMYEAAEMDGANVWQKISRITLPQLFPTIKIVFLLMLVGSLRTFDMAFLMSNGLTEAKINTLAVYIYDMGLQRMDLGVANAAGIVLLFISVVLALMVQRVVKS